MIVTECVTEMGRDISDFKFDMTQVEGFRYRVEDGLRAVTGTSVREARLKDLKNEVINSEKLKVYKLHIFTVIFVLTNDTVSF